MRDDDAPPLALMAAAEMLPRLKPYHSVTLAEKRTLVDGQMAHSAREAAALGTPLACRGSGCFGCCRGSIAVSIAEVRDILPHVSEEALDRAEAHADELSREDGRAWCPLLDPESKTCTVYERRPLVCRGYNTVGDPDDCWPERVGSKEIPSIAEPQAMALAFLVMWQFAGDEGGPLGAILAAIAKDRRR